MKRRRFLKTTLVPAGVLWFGPSLHGNPQEAAIGGSGNLKVGLTARGIPRHIESDISGSRRVWMRSTPYIGVRNEVTNVSASPSHGEVPGLDLKFTSKWSSSRHGLVWDMFFEGAGKRTGYEITIDLPVLSSELRIFTPSNEPEFDVGARPTYRPVPYATKASKAGKAYVLPLITLMDPQRDLALTIGLPPNVNIPDLQFQWIGGRVLRLTLGHRGMGERKVSPLRLLFYSHRADYRGALKAYSDEFPAYFEPPMPRSQAEGTFYYHNIQDHPAFVEMARQDVHYLWASFWFKYLGDYLPNGSEWAPYTYARWWKFQRMMSDEKINSFIDEMNRHGVGVYAYFNVTEYGGRGGKDGSVAVPARLLRSKFSDALVKDVRGCEVPTWEGARVVNPRPDLSIWRELKEQCERHFPRLPNFQGFIIDRLDWASTYDYAHDDGFSTIGDHAVENMAQPVAGAVQSICRMAHAAKKRVFVNQFYRVEVLRDVDGYCHEIDYVPALAYLAPYRPVSAWERRDYQGSLLDFEKQMKVRLQFAVFPHMIAHHFPLAQQDPNPRAADFLDLYAPLFETLIGKRQVLLPHCVAATGENDVNLFLNGSGEYVAPLTSRTRYRSRGDRQLEDVRITLKTPDAGKLHSANVYSADVPSYSATISSRHGVATIRVPKHGTASVIVARK